MSTDPSAHGINGLITDGVARVDYTGFIEAGGVGIFIVTTGTGGSDIKLGQVATDLNENTVSGTLIRSRNHGIYSNTGTSSAIADIRFHNSVAIKSDAMDIRGRSGNENIHNFGEFTNLGSIDLESGANSFTNYESARFFSGTDIILFDTTDPASTGILINAGDISPGGIAETVIFEAVYDDDGTLLSEEISTKGIQHTEITGNFEMRETGTYSVTVNAAGESDRLIVIGGTAYLNSNGWVVVYPDGGYAYDTPYTIMTAENGIEGEFAGLINTAFVSGAFRDHVLDYGKAKQVDLILKRLAGPCDLAFTNNHEAVGCDAISPLFDDVETLSTDHDIAQLILQLETADEVRSAYDMLSGEAYASHAGVLIEESSERRAALMERTRQRHREYINEAAYGLSLEPVHNTLAGAGWWSSAYGGHLDRDATASNRVTAAALTSQSSGFLIGLDGSRDGFTFGFAGGRGVSDTEVDDRNFSADTETWSLAAYGAATIGPSRLSFGAMADWHSVEADRNVAIGAFSEHLSADTEATTWQAFVELEADLTNLSSFAPHPFARLAHVRNAVDGFSEISAGDGMGDPVADSAALTLNDTDNSVTYSVLGLRNSFAFDRINVTSSLGWRHAFGDIDPSIDVSLAGSNHFSITGSPVAEDTLIAELGAQIDLQDNVALILSYSGQLSEDSQSHGANLRLQGRF